jgi:hypothetical protein
MFTVKLKDGTILPATSVEESYRPEYAGTAHISLTIQNSSAGDDEALDTIKPKLTADALSSIQVFTEADAKDPAKTYTGYQYVRYLMNRLQPDGKTLLDMNFTKEDLTQV